MELLTVSEMSRADAIAAQAGHGSFALMQAAGRAVAMAATRLVPDGPVLVVAGTGNNGGDGFVAAAELVEQGRRVEMVLLGDPAALKGDAREAWRLWGRGAADWSPARLAGVAIVIDAVFGAGLARPVTGVAAEAIAAINASGLPVLAVDLPSGINGDSGEVAGVAIRAARTVTFFRKKPGHLLLPGRAHCGPVEAVDIGIPIGVLDEIKPATFENDIALWRDVVPVPRIEGHKYSRGHAVVASGPAHATGAARLSARAALRVGAGLVTVASPPDAVTVNAVALTAVMVRPVADAAAFAEMLADTRLNACVIGPGLGRGPYARDLALAVLRANRALVLDADGLTSFSDSPAALFGAVAAAALAGSSRVVFTPHTGEFSKLFSQINENSEVRSKLEKARIAAERSAAVIVLKGADTVVAAPDGRASIASNAPPWLATAGSGDVLAGLIGGLLAQGLPAFDAANLGVWLHGEAGRHAGPGLIAEDLPDIMPAVLRALYASLGVHLER